MVQSLPLAPNVIGNNFGIGPQILLLKWEVLAPFKFSVNIHSSAPDPGRRFEHHI